MNIQEAINNLVKSDKTKNYGDFEKLCSALGTHSIGWSQELEDKIERYYVQSWLCTDTYVGVCIYFFEDQPFAISTQQCRKCEEVFSFFDEALVAKVRLFLHEIYDKMYPLDFTFISLTDELPVLRN